MTPLQFVLDTDLFTLFAKGIEPVRSRVDAAAGLAVSVITVDEELSGWYALVRKATQPAKLAYAYEQLAHAVVALGQLPIVTYDLPAMAEYDRLKRMKLGVKKNDLRIAAIALVHGAAVVTRNLADFRRVPHLSVEDWSAPPGPGPVSRPSESPPGRTG